MKTFYRAAALSTAALSLFLSPLSAAADTPPKHVRGTIASFTGSTVTIATATGPMIVSLTAKTGFAAATPGTTADIKPGTFIGSANVPGSGASRALEVTVFADALRGVGEGDYAWDLPASGSHSMMTNGTVGAPKMSSMTNATVSHVMGGSTKTISVAYKGGTKQITIPPNAPVVKIAPGSPKLLTKGAHAFAIVASPAGKPTAVFVVIGQGSTVPPM